MSVDVCETVTAHRNHEAAGTPFAARAAAGPGPGSAACLPETLAPTAQLWRAGAGVLDDHELLSALLGGERSRQARPAARAILDRSGGLSALTRVGPAWLTQVPGVGRARAVRLAACVELARRLAARAPRAPTSLATPAAVAAFLAPRVSALDVEHMWVRSLDGNNGLQGVRCVARGGQHGCTVTAREILRSALGDAASGFVLVHNHPSGDATPSPEDARMTRVVARAADAVGTPLLDHVIVTPSGAYTSLLEEGVL